MFYIKQIMEMLRIDEDAAFKVYDLLTVNLSECTDQEFYDNVAEAAKEMGYL